jgi:hypothetical protein
MYYVYICGTYLQPSVAQLGEYQMRKWIRQLFMKEYIWMLFENLETLHSIFLKYTII